MQKDSGKYFLKVNKTLRHVYVFLINDENAILASASTLSLKQTQANVKNCFDLGVHIAKKCIELDIIKVAFLRNGFKYHGRIKSLADGARKQGVVF